MVGVYPEIASPVSHQQQVPFEGNDGCGTSPFGRMLVRGLGVVVDQGSHSQLLFPGSRRHPGSSAYLFESFCNIVAFTSLLDGADQPGKVGTVRLWRVVTVHHHWACVLQHPRQPGIKPKHYLVGFVPMYIPH